MSRARSSRMRKVDELIREVLAEEIGKLKDPRIGFVTVTGVETAPDLRRATVFYSVLGEEEEQEATAEALAHAAPHLQARLGHQVRMKFTPRLTFTVDPSIAHASRITRLLYEIDADHNADDPEKEESE